MQKRIVENRTVLDCIGFDLVGKGQLAVRFQLTSFCEDGSYIDDGSRNGPIQRMKYRFVLHPGDDIDALIVSITPHLDGLGYGAPSEVDVTKLKAIAAVCWTLQAVEQHSKRWLDWLSQHEAQCRSLGVPAMTLHQAMTTDFVQRVGVSLDEMHALPSLVPDIDDRN